MNYENTLITTLLRRLSLIAVCLILAGCKYHVIKHYSFDDFSHSYSWGIVKGRLLGTDRDLNDADANHISTDAIGSPYELILKFSVNQQKTINITACEVLVRSLKIVKTASQDVAFSVANRTERFTLLSDKGYDDAFVSVPVPLEYNDYYIDMDFTLPANCFKDSRENGGENGHVRFLVKRAYREEKLSAWAEFLVGLSSV
jgi:hypothetical protein